MLYWEASFLIGMAFIGSNKKKGLERAKKGLDVGPHVSVLDC